MRDVCGRATAIVGACIRLSPCLVSAGSSPHLPILPGTYIAPSSTSHAASKPFVTCPQCAEHRPAASVRLSAACCSLHLPMWERRSSDHVCTFHAQSSPQHRGQSHRKMRPGSLVHKYKPCIACSPPITRIWARSIIIYIAIITNEARFRCSTCPPGITHSPEQVRSASDEGQILGSKSYRRTAQGRQNLVLHTHIPLTESASSAVSTAVCLSSHRTLQKILVTKAPSIEANTVRVAILGAGHFHGAVLPRVPCVGHEHLPSAEQNRAHCILSSQACLSLLQGIWVAGTCHKIASPKVVTKALA